LQHRLSPLRKHLRAQQQRDVMRHDGNHGGVYALCRTGQRHGDL
jgi:hypothetical protein